MNRRRALAATGVVAIALAGCGGSSNKQLSYSDFISKANDLCREGQAKSNQAQNAREASKIIHTYIERFQDLEPPAKLKPAYDDFVSVSKEQESALESGDVAEANELNPKSNEAASKMGTAGCISQ